MSLRYQIHLRILFTLLIVLSFGGTTLILQARQSVAKEVQSSVQLALQLVKLSINKTHHSHVDNNATLRDIALLKETQQLNIQLKQQSGELLQLSASSKPTHILDTPSWFVWMVARPYPTVNYPLVTADHKTVQIMISANALDEISEAWQETKVFFGIILLLSAGLFLAVNLIFKQVLRTVESILKNLTEIEVENYQNPLPHFAIAEFNRIALAINHLTATLHKAQQENNRLTLHSLEIQEEQRQTLAQELHDEFGQSITAIKVMAVTGKKASDNGKEIYQSIIQVCEHLVSVVRSMMKNLHPLILTELGLSASLHDLITHWHTRALSLKISLECDVEIDVIEAKIAIQVFRIIQEGITNAVRHAQAKKLLISLHLNHCSDLVIIIEDDGVGCDKRTLCLGFGLLGMQARVKSLKGSMQILTAKNQGMKINITIPVNYER
jgi:two-component system sensor histidine kinase UhpB